MKKNKKPESTSSTRPNLYDYLKTIALLTMIMDHIGYYLFPDQLRLRFIGRIAFPIFLFLVGFNGSYRWKWGLFWRGMFLWGITAWIARKFWFWWFEANILIGILFSRVLLHRLTKRKEIWVWILCFSLLAISHYWLKEYLDYGALPFFFVLWWRLAKHKTWGIFFWISIMIWLLIQNILVFDFGVSKWQRHNAAILSITYLILTILFALLTKENLKLSWKNWVNQIILRLSKHCLLLYGIHILLLLVIGLRKFQLI